ncbi:MAG: hypothetical protein ABSF53_23770 [Terracidiphilus sp.]|jgi:hypothetical protein
MEPVLNLLWVLLTALMFGLWVRFGPRTGSNKRNQCVALVFVVLLLFPVISVTDDLQATLNPAEADSWSRCDHACAAPHSIPTSFAAPPVREFAGLSFHVLRMASAEALLSPAMDRPALDPIQNLPPPAG